MKRLFTLLIVTITLTACEKPLTTETNQGPTGNLVLSFNTPWSGTTRGATGNLSDHFEKLAVMLFNAETGERALSTVKTQTVTDESFGTLTLSATPGNYSLVAVGHSSVKTPTLKSPVMVQFTASDGEKLTDTFSFQGNIEVTETPTTRSYTLDRVVAMVKFVFTDDIPGTVSHVKFDYTGGSANFNPTTKEGTTKSTQSENRPYTGITYQVYTFPYLARSGLLKIKVSALDDTGVTLNQKTLDSVPVTRNRITVYTGSLMDGNPGVITTEDFGFTVNPDWEGTDTIRF